jgi:hypothetical protein
MAVKSSTFQIALLVILIVGIILIIQSSWTLAQLNKTVGDACSCSGVTDQDLTSLRMFATVTLFAGIGVIVYAVLMLIMPGGSKVDHSQHGRIASRFASQTM